MSPSVVTSEVDADDVADLMADDDIVADDELVIDDEVAIEPPPTLVKITEECGIDFPHDTDVVVARALKGILVDGRMPEDEALKRTSLVLILKTIDPEGYPTDGVWQEGDLPTLQSIFLTEITHRKYEDKFARIHRELAPHLPPRLPSQVPRPKRK